jgi:hypothetical protein
LTTHGVRGNASVGLRKDRNEERDEESVAKGGIRDDEDGTKDRMELGRGVDAASVETEPRWRGLAQGIEAVKPF